MAKNTLFSMLNSMFSDFLLVFSGNNVPYFLVKTHIALINQWKLFCLEKSEPHVQLSFSTDAGLLVKNLYLKHPNRKYTIKFLADIQATGSFRTLADLEHIIRLANFRPDSIEWKYDRHGDQEIVRFIRHPY